MHWSENREKGAAAGALCPSLEPSASPISLKIKATIFCFQIFFYFFFVAVVVVVTFPQHRAHRSKERSEYLIAVIS